MTSYYKTIDGKIQEIEQAQDVNFGSVLTSELGKTKYTSLDEKIKDVSLSNLNVSPYRDQTSYSYRLDGNNVDVDTENVEMAANQIQYKGMVDSMTQEFNRLKQAMK